MKTMSKRLSDLASICLCFVVALTLAAPYSGAAAYANTIIQDSITTQDEFDIAAYSISARASVSLDEAQSNLETAKSDKATADENLPSAKDELDEKVATYNDAAKAHSAALKEAEAAKAKADKDIDAAVAKTQQEVRAAELAYQTAYKNWEDARQAEEAAKEQLTAAQTAHNEAEAALSTAISGSGNSGLAAAKAELDRAKAALASAEARSVELRDTRNALEKEKNEALAAYQAAGPKVTAAQAAADSAAAALSTAQTNLDNARAERNNAPEDLTPQYQAAVDTAQTKVTEATNNKAAADSRLADAKAVEDAAKEKLATAQANLTAALEAAGIGNIDELQQAVTRAQAAYDAAAIAYTNETGVSVTLSDAQSVYATAQNNYANAQTTTANAKSALDAAQARLDSLAAGGSGASTEVLSLKSYLDDTYSTDASNEFNYSSMVGSTNLGASGDATNTSNIATAIAIIQSLNNYRAGNSVGTLQVTDDLMALGALAANYYAANYSTDGAGVEIVLTNIYSAPSSWYDLPDYSGYDATALDSTYIYVGAGFNSNGVAVLRFGDSYASSVGAAEPATWESNFNTWLNNKQNNTSGSTDEGDREALQQEVNRLQGEWENAVSAEAAAKRANDAAATLAEKATALIEVNNSLGGSDPSSPIYIAQQAVAQATDEVTLAHTEVVRIEGEIGSYDTAIAEGNSELAAAQAAMNAYHAPDYATLDAKVASAQEAWNEANQKNADAAAKLDAESKALDDALQLSILKEGQYNDAVSAYNTYNNTTYADADDAYNYADTQYRNAGGYAPEIASYTLAAERAYRTLEDTKTTVHNAELTTAETYAAYVAATGAEDAAKAKLQTVTEAAEIKKEQSIDAAITALNKLVGFEDFANMNNHLETITKHQNAIFLAAEPMTVAKAALDEAQGKYDHWNNLSTQASNNISYWTDYIEHYGEQPSGDDNTNNGDNNNQFVQEPSNNNTPSGTPAGTAQANNNNSNNNSKAKNNNSSSNGKKTTKASTASKKSDKEPAAEEATEAPVAKQTTASTTAPVKKSPSFFGIDPLIAGIVGIALVAAAAAAIAVGVVRARRAKANADQPQA